MKRNKAVGKMTLGNEVRTVDYIQIIEKHEYQVLKQNKTSTLIFNKPITFCVCDTGFELRASQLPGRHSTT
jgi:hypothetical protein